jgi:hypothetical protein
MKTDMDIEFLKMKNKTGMSGMIVAIIMIAMVLLVGGIVWSVVNNLIQGEIGKGSSCFGILDKVTIERKYTCFDSDNNIARIQLVLGDIDVEGVLISISDNTTSKEFTLTYSEQIIENLVTYSGEPLVLPGKNNGTTYNYSWDEDSRPNNVRIAPIIKGNRCEVSDTLSGIDNCSLIR